MDHAADATRQPPARAGAAPRSGGEDRTGEGDAASSANPLVEIRDLAVRFPLGEGFFSGRARGWIHAVSGVSLDVARGETLGLVGESGCGKSTLARAALHLVAPTAGSVRFDGRDLSTLGVQALRRARRDFQIVFQDPYASLNPRMTVFDALAEPLRAHRIVRRGDALRRRVAALMEQVEMPSRAMRKYPHEFSGGQRQRIAVARALALEPRFLVADEPVSALDVSVQAGVLNLLRRLRDERGLAMLFISHDLAVVRHVSHRIAVMYLGRIVETGPAEAVFAAPRHPYARALVAAAPRLAAETENAPEPIMLEGDPPSPSRLPPGCAFHPRCPWATDACRAAVPALRPAGPRRAAACIRFEEIDRGA